MAFSSLFLAAEGGEGLSNLVNTIGMELFEEEIDDVIFQTNEFLTDASFTGEGGPFFMILQMCMCLGALFAIIAAAGMAYKMMLKGESFDPLKIIRVLGIAIVMFWWYPSYGGYSFLDGLAYIPNCIGSYTHDLYEAEAAQVQDKFDELKPLIIKRDTMYFEKDGSLKAAYNTVLSPKVQESAGESAGTETTVEQGKQAAIANGFSSFAGLMVGLDKIVIFLALVIYRIGWWATIYIQQIMLGMLTIFGPIMWAFSILPKWEGAWAKWLTRYLTVHFYGAMLYFVGFYVLLLFDIVLSIQIDQLETISETPEVFMGYVKAAFMTAGYLLAASIVSVKCLSIVPDLAAWMIPEGDTTFSARSFGEGVASQMSNSAKGKLL